MEIGQHQSLHDVTNQTYELGIELVSPVWFCRPRPCYSEVKRCQITAVPHTPKIGACMMVRVELNCSQSLAIARWAGSYIAN